jgi:hypothetical protein
MWKIDGKPLYFKTATDTTYSYSEKGHYHNIPVNKKPVSYGSKKYLAEHEFYETKDGKINRPTFINQPTEALLTTERISRLNTYSDGVPINKALLKDDMGQAMTPEQMKERVLIIGKNIENLEKAKEDVGSEEEKKAIDMEIDELGKIIEILTDQLEPKNPFLEAQKKTNKLLEQLIDSKDEDDDDDDEGDDENPLLESQITTNELLQQLIETMKFGKEKKDDEMVDELPAPSYITLDPKVSSNFSEEQARSILKAYNLSKEIPLEQKDNEYEFVIENLEEDGYEVDNLVKDVVKGFIEKPKDMIFKLGTDGFWGFFTQIDGKIQYRVLPTIQKTQDINFLNQFLYDSLKQGIPIEIISDDDIRLKIEQINEITSNPYAKDETTRMITPKKWQLLGLLEYYLKNNQMPVNSEKFGMGILNQYRRRGKLSNSELRTYIKNFKDAPDDIPIFDLSTPKKEKLEEEKPKISPKDITPKKTSRRNKFDLSKIVDKELEGENILTRIGKRLSGKGKGKGKGKGRK